MFKRLDELDYVKRNINSYQNEHGLYVRLYRGKKKTEFLARSVMDWLVICFFASGAGSRMSAVKGFSRIIITR